MKKLAMVLAAVLVLAAFMAGAQAEDLGVVIIAPEEEQQAPASGTLDNLKLKTPVEVENFGTITPSSFEFIDDFVYVSGQWSQSGAEADYAYLRVDVLNTTDQPADYLESASVEVIFKDKIHYEGWCRQFDYNESDAKPVLKDRGFAINPYYVGHYVFGCALPNAVVGGKDPLKMIVKLGDIEMTYVIR